MQAYGSSGDVQSRSRGTSYGRGSLTERAWFRFSQTQFKSPNWTIFLKHLERQLACRKGSINHFFFSSLLNHAVCNFIHSTNIYQRPTIVLLPGETHGQESSRLHSIGSERVGRDWSDLMRHFIYIYIMYYIHTHTHTGDRVRIKTHWSFLSWGSDRH